MAGALFIDMLHSCMAEQDIKHHCVNVTKTEDVPHATLEIKAELPWNEVEKYRAKALRHLQKEASMDGFRKGHVPEAIILKNLGEGTILQETADVAIQEELPLLLAAERVPGISTPKVSVTKLAPGNPLGFTVTVEVLPKIELPDYKALAAKENGKRTTVEVTEKEVQDVLLYLRKERAKIEFIEKGEKPEDAAEKIKELEEKDLPPIDDEFVKGLGYESAEKFTEKLKGNIQTDKEAQEKDKVRISIIDSILAKTTLGVPHSLIHHEIDKMEAQFADDLARAGTNLADYLKNINKTHEELHTEWHEPAEKRAKVQLILGDIAMKEGVKANPEEVTAHITHTMKHHKDAQEHNVRAYFEHMLRNEAVLKWLEEQK